jgi:hypothetical protein
MVTALLLAGIAYPAMLMATGAPMRSVSHWGAHVTPCAAIETAEAVFPAGDAGDVTLERSTDALRVVSAAPAEDWEFRIDDGGPDSSVAVVFDGDDARVFFRAAIIDCQVRIQVTREVVATFAPAPSETSDAAPIQDAAAAEIPGEQAPAETPDAAPAESPEETPPEETPEAKPAEAPEDTPAQGTPAETPGETSAESPEATPAPAPADGAQVGTLQAEEAGTVTVRLADGLLTVLSVDPGDGWTYEVDKEGPKRMVRVRFRSDDGRVQLAARIQNGEVVVRIRSVSIGDFGDGTPVDPTDPANLPTTPVREVPDPIPAPGAPADVADNTRMFPVGPAGSVTLRRKGTTLEVVSVETKHGWTSETPAAGPAEDVSVRFAGLDGFAFELHATVDDDRITFDVRRVQNGEVDADTRPLRLGSHRNGDAPDGDQKARMSGGERNGADRRGDRNRGRDNDR